MDMAEGWGLESNQGGVGKVGAGPAGLFPSLHRGRTAGPGVGRSSDLGLEKALSCTVPLHQSGP